MKLITSGDNPIFKAAAQLKLKKHRDEQKKYLIEGPNLIREALGNGGEIELIIQSADLNEDYLINEKLGTVLNAVNVAVMPSVLFHKLSDTESPQGIMAVVKKRVYSADEFFAVEQRETFHNSNIIVLDRLQDPGNIGTILRTADAAGYLGAIILKGTADIYSPKIARAAAGSLFRLPTLMADTPSMVVDLLKEFGKKIVCTTPNCDRYYYEADLAENAAVIIGNEGNGVCDEFIDRSDMLVKIPMQGTIESLNAAVSAGILMYESVRQRYKK